MTAIATTFNPVAMLIIHKRERAQPSTRRRGVRPDKIGRESALSRLAETCNCIRFVVEGVEHRQKLGDHQKVLNLLRQVQQLQMPALVACRRIRTDQLADAGAVYVGNISQVKQNLLLAIVEQFAHRLTKLHAAFADGYLARKIQYRYVACLAFLNRKLSHRTSPLSSSKFV